MTNDRNYQVALTMINGIGAVQAKNLIDHFESAAAVFKASKKELSSISGIGEIKAKEIKAFDLWNDAEKEITFCEKHHIDILFLNDENYPKRLLNCYDAPTVLYYRGNANLNQPKIISIIGTRNNTDYGKQVTENIIEQLATQQVLIVSGLAFGIDSIAHKAALQQHLPTVGVLAHGLDTIYPSQHKAMAKDMLLNGGLLTEFKQNTKPDKHNFPRRNRIVSGISDATIVIETAAKGGSMITAELTYNYNRDLFAVPGKITDNKSNGCLKLIQQQKAVVFTSVEDFLQEMSWQENKNNSTKKQRELFIELSDDEKIIVDILKEKELLNIDEIYLQSGLSSSSVAAAILSLELQNTVASLPGKIYKLI
jgi:DNA processing protein